MTSIMLLGAYGQFGKRIAQALAKQGIPLILTGRDTEKCHACLQELQHAYPDCSLTVAVFDAFTTLPQHLKKHKPCLVIHTCGPFQGQDYTIAEHCIEQSIHYLDLADSRDFVRDITTLDSQAKVNKVAVISGASSVPALSSAVIEAYREQFSTMDKLVFGINPGQKTPRGLATVQAILSIVGKRLQTCIGATGKRYGWQDMYRIYYPGLGYRLMGNCDIPDLDLFPAHYGFRTIQFSGGMENRFLHCSLWLFSWLIRAGLPIHLEKHARLLTHIARWFDRFGTDTGGMHMIIQGKDKQGKNQTLKWFIIAKDNHGPNIPTIPAIILAKQIYHNEWTKHGAMPCVGLVTLEQYMAHLVDYTIYIHTDWVGEGWGNR